MKARYLFSVLLLSTSVVLASDTLPAASDLLFRHSNLQGARSTAARVLKQHPADLDAMFIEMEAAALQADTTAELDAALRICETGVTDPRATIAAARILDLAANTSAFRAIASRVRRLANSKTTNVRYFRSALLAAATDGLAGDSVRDLAAQNGFLTDWRLAGPFGRFANVDFDRTWPPEHAGLNAATSDERTIESFHFDDGNVALPEYFASRGVYYGESETTAATTGDFFVRAESTGTLAVAIDSKIVLVRDQRFREAPAVALTRVRLQAGAHRVQVKFLLSASPLRIAIFPAERVTTVHAGDTMSEAESKYVAGALKYWTGDYAGAITNLENAKPSAPQRFLLALTWARIVDGESAETLAWLRATLALSPDAAAAETMLASSAYSAERIDDALEQLRNVLTRRTDYLPAQELRFEIAARLNWQSEAADAIEARLRLNPSCSTLRAGIKFFSESGHFDRAVELQDKLENCAPSSLDYIGFMSRAGRHRQAADAARAKVMARPLDRNARYLLVRELRLAGEFVAAKTAAAELQALAPNSERFGRLADQAESLAQVEDVALRTAGFASRDEFYAPYRRDAFEIVNRTKARQFSGGPAVTLLDDRVLNLLEDGTAAIYVHKITRLLSREGIDRYGEVLVPENAELLELRTLKSDGSTVEPDFFPNKPTVSMAALVPGDAIEQEYILRYAKDSLIGHADAFRYKFGSFDAPILFARFVVLSPAGSPQPIAASAGVPQPVVKSGGAERMWEKNDIAQSLREPSMPASDDLPTVRVLPSHIDDWQQVQTYYRDVVIGLTRTGSRSQQIATTISGGSAEQRARALYRLVTSKIRPIGTGLGPETVEAEDTLAKDQGSRTAALLALARAAGLRADLVLARDTGVPETERPSLDAFTHPLVRFNFPGKAFLADAESDGLPFGVIAPNLDTKRAIAIWLEAPAGTPIFIALSAASEKERSFAQGDVTLDDAGDLYADLRITLGATRGAQTRAALRALTADGRQHFFEQIAMRIFRGASEVHGDVRQENDSERQLVLHIICRSPGFARFTDNSTEIDQLAPALNLRKMYVSGSTRQFSLYIDSPLFESATFHLHLPPDERVLSQPANLEERNEFGTYALGFRQLGLHTLEISRSFHVPIQVITADKYGDFVRFATRIDDAERQRLTLGRVDVAASKRRTNPPEKFASVSDD